jgi:polysaccharide biosynthesis protein PslG
MQANAPRSAFRVVPIACLAAALLLGLAVTACGKAPGPAGGSPQPPPPTAGVSPGLLDTRLDTRLPAGSPGTLAAIREDTQGLHSAWLRMDVYWSDVEPARGRYDRARLARLDELVAAIHAAGAHILLTVRDCPVWASDPAWWSHPPRGIDPGYQPAYPISQAALPRLGDFAQFQARRYAGRVQALECWNEPNFWWFLYPQRTRGDAHFGAHTYLRMLKAFSAGVRRAHTGVLVVAGGTASMGYDDAFGTSPQRFAGYLARHGAASLFDVYSVHAYTPGASVHRAPGAVPDRPATTVTLGNLGTLLRLFPEKPFYVTEYGYNTRPSSAFVWFKVSEAKQASYLQSAFAVAARYPQVRLLTWYLVVDEGPRAGKPADSGVYTGLRRTNGVRKPSWYAFAQVGSAYARAQAQASK